MQEPVSDSLIDRLRQLDADATTDLSQPSKLTRLVIGKRRRQHTNQRAVRFSCVAILVVCGGLIVLKSFGPSDKNVATDSVAGHVAPRIVEDHVADSADVMRIKREFEVLREQSAQVRWIAEQLDAVVEQQEILDGVMRELELRNMEKSIRNELSESLVITASYDFGY